MILTRTATLVLTLTAACAFEPNGLGGLGDADSGTVGDPDGGGQPSPDAAPLEDIHHVALAQEYLGSEDVRLSDTVTIDTMQLTVSAGGPAALVPMQAQSDGSGPELAIVHVRDLIIEGTLRAVGSRPLVIIARTIRIDGLLDVGARRGEMGAGGSGPGSGDGRGGAGLRHGMYFDTGGGGGGFARDGGLGGNDGSGEGDGAPGPSYGDAMLTSLVGGSGGGSSDGDCGEGPAGAGGGAVQLYAAVTIAIGDSGGINAGGGGGSPGHACPLQYTAGRGGGSGGAIYLQSPSVVLDGTLAANGGGGGGSSGAAFTNGSAGADGQLDDLRPRGGARGGSDYGADGGDGGTDDSPENGDDNDGDGNGGGGGGSSGRIVVRARSSQLGGTVSPSAAVSQ